MPSPCQAPSQPALSQTQHQTCGGKGGKSLWPESVPAQSAFLSQGVPCPGSLPWLLQGSLSLPLFLTPILIPVPASVPYPDPYPCPCRCSSSRSFSLPLFLTPILIPAGIPHPDPYPCRCPLPRSFSRPFQVPVPVPVPLPQSRPRRRRVRPALPLPTPPPPPIGCCCRHLPSVEAGKEATHGKGIGAKGGGGGAGGQSARFDWLEQVSPAPGAARSAFGTWRGLAAAGALRGKGEYRPGETQTLRTRRLIRFPFPSSCC